MRKLVIFVLPALFILSGCWDYKDLNKLSIVAGMGFDDAGGGEIKVTIEIIDRSSAPKKNGLRTRSVEIAEKSIGNAVEKISKGLDFELYYGAMAVAVIGDGAPVKTVETWLRDERDVRETVYIVRAENASELLQTEEDGGIASYTIRDIIDASEDDKPLELYKTGGARYG
jgi:spore germination protein KC